jgi:cytochrome c-type biogenesis protein
MTPELASTILLPIGLGLLGFVEPCSIGTTLLFMKLMEGKPAVTKLGQVAAFATSRALFTGLLGGATALVGAALLDFQKVGWVLMGLVYAAIGVLYLAGHAGWMMRRIGPALGDLGEMRSSIAFGMLFGLSIPACAGPLLLALLAASAAGVTGGNVARGFVALALFGLALSLPLVVAVLFPGARRAMDWLAALSAKMPLWTGLLMIALGLWSMWFGFFVAIA